MYIKLGFDFGASRIKASAETEGKIYDVCFPNTVDYNTTMAFSGTRVDYNGETLMIGGYSGFSNRQQRKVNSNFLPCMLFNAVYHLKKQVDTRVDCIELDILAVLPPRQLMETRDKFKYL